MKTNTYCGWLDTGCFDGKNISVRYWISDVEDCIERIKENATKILMGDCTAEYCARYSDITGYLWTDDKLNVGGHNLLRELESFVGKYLVLEIEVPQ